MTGAPNTFREGASALRNARGWYNETLERIPRSRETGPQSQEIPSSRNKPPNRHAGSTERLLSMESATERRLQPANI
jgi:hypothetical protein